MQIVTRLVSLVNNSANLFARLVTKIPIFVTGNVSLNVLPVILVKIFFVKNVINHVWNVLDQVFKNVNNVKKEKV